MGVLGFAVNFISLLKVAEDILTGSRVDLGKPVKYILTYKFSQDHLEILFACIRKYCGSNNNPSVVEFESAIKKILFRSGVTLYWMITLT